MRIVGFVAAIVLVCAPVAQAQDFEAAAKHFGAAQDAFGKSHYHVAAAEFQLAFDITKDPVLLYNIGEAWQKGGEGKKAVTAYKAYLKAQPAAQDRADVQKRVKTIVAKHYKLANQSAPGDEAVAVAKVEPPPVPAPPPAPPAPAPSEKAAVLTPDFDAPTKPAEPTVSEPPATVAATAPAAVAPEPAAAPAPSTAPAPGILEDQPVSRMRVAAWIGVAATLGVLAAGAIFGLSAQARADEISRRFSFVDANGQPSAYDAAAQKDYHDLKNDGHLYNDLAIGFFSASGALAITTVVLFVVDWKHPQPRKHAWRLSPQVNKDGATVNLGWSF